MIVCFACAALYQRHNKTKPLVLNLLNDNARLPPPCAVATLELSYRMNTQPTSHISRSEK